MPSNDVLSDVGLESGPVGTVGTDMGLLARMGHHVKAKVLLFISAFELSGAQRTAQPRGLRWLLEIAKFPHLQQTRAMAVVSFSFEILFPLLSAFYCSA